MFIICEAETEQFAGGINNVEFWGNSGDILNFGIWPNGKITNYNMGPMS